MGRKVHQITDIKYAVQLYYSRIEIGSSEIGKLFNVTGSAAIAKKKKEAQALMKEKHIPACGCYSVNTEVAYEAWGLDISQLERRLKKIEQFGAV